MLSALCCFQGPGAGAHFKDETDARGFKDTLNNITWSAALVDYDMDGDSDLFLFDDRGQANSENLDRGFVHIWKNDGTGHFEFVSPEEAGIDSASNMGHAFGDFNCDGNMDFFVTRLGSFLGTYMVQDRGIPTEGMSQLAKAGASTWIFGSGNGTFLSGNASHGANGHRPYLPFGWGAAAIDLEADGDQDIVYVGGLIGPDFSAGSPGVALENIGCTGTYERYEAFRRGNYNNYVTSGISAGDLNNDGFVDLVVTAGKGCICSIVK